MTDFRNEFKAYMTSTYPKAATLSNARVDEYVSKLEKRFKEGDEVIDLIKDLDDLVGFEQIALTDEQLRTFKSKQKEEPKQTQPEQKPEPVQDPNAELLKTLLAEVQGLKAEKQAESLKSKFFNDERLKGIDKKFLERYVPRDVDSFDQEIKEATTLWNELKIAKYGNDTPPIGVGGVKQKTDKEIQETINRINKNK